MMHRCAIIGVLENGSNSLSQDAIKRLREADVIIGGVRTLKLLAAEFKPGSTSFDLTGKLSQVPEWIRQTQQDGLRCVVLATGDPLCHGIAAYLLSRLCVDAFDILPNVSTIALACARVSLPWQNIEICSVHSKDAGEWMVGATPSHGLYALRRSIALHDRLAILTSPVNTPDRIARMLVLENLAEQFQMAVVSELETAEETLVRDIPITELARRKFADPNVVLLWRSRLRSEPVLFGVVDHEFQQRYPEKGLITKREVRAVSLARLQLRSHSIVWDIGAGSGSVGLEAARLCPQGHVYAIEKNAIDCDNVMKNRAQWGVHNFTLLQGRAPQGLEQWPDPDAVFIGGSSGEMAELIKLISQRLRHGGTLVINVVTLENLTTALDTLNQTELQWDVTQIQTSRSKPILDMQRLAAENPVFIISACKGVNYERGEPV